MKLVETNWHPTDSQLKQFGVTLIALPLVGWIWEEAQHYFDS